MNALNKHKVIIIEPSPALQQGIKMLLESTFEFEVLYCFRDLQSFEAIANKPTFDILLINPAAINYHKQLYVKTLLPQYPDAAIVAIAYSYVDAETMNSFDGVLDIYDESVVMIKKLKKIVGTTGHQKKGANAAKIDLTDREKEILISVAKGLTNKEIADKYFLSVHTVIAHRKNISRKTGIKTASGYTVYAIFKDLLSEEDF